MSAFGTGQWPLNLCESVIIRGLVYYWYIITTVGIL